MASLIIGKEYKIGFLYKNSTQISTLTYKKQTFKVNE